MAIRMLLVDDHILFREAMTALLSQQTDLSVVGEAGTAQEAFSQMDAIAPDLVVVDITLPGLSGIAVTRELLRRWPRCPVLILSMHSANDIVAQAASAGASGFVRKDEPAEVVLRAIRTVAHGGRHFGAGISAALLDAPARKRRGVRGVEGSLGALSSREREVFDLTVQGFSNQNMARELAISIKTIETHRTSINRKLGIHSTGDLVRFAAARGLVLG